MRALLLHRDVQFTEAQLAELMGRVLEASPRREATTADELRAQEILGDELAARGLEVSLEPFVYSRNLYAVIALHFAVATAGSLVHLWLPWVAAGLHLLAGVSYLLDCHYRGFWLRRCFPMRRSQNVIGRMSAVGEVRRRVVIMAHADAAPTGWMFYPSFLHRFHVAWPNWLCLLRKQMGIAMLALLILIVLDVIRATTGYWRPGLHIGLTLIFAVTLVLLIQIVVTNRTVPGANDNLTGCAALVALADRLQANKPDDVELVFVVTGCEESGRGGAWRLWRAMRNQWPRENTLVLGLDTLSGGVLRYHVEGEILPIWPTRKLLQCVEQIGATDVRFAGMTAYHAPAGATDVAPFLCHGYDGLCLVSVDPASDLPRDYHVMEDNLANIDFRQVADAVDFAEKLVLAVC